MKVNTSAMSEVVCYVHAIVRNILWQFASNVMWLQMLFAKGETQFGTNEVVFNRVLCRRGFHQLKEIFAAYEGFHKQGMIDTIKREFSGVAESAYKAIGKNPC